MHGKGKMRRALWPLIAGHCLLLLSGCSRAHANVAPDQPALQMPEPPPREVEATDAEMPAPMALPEEPARRTPPRARTPQRAEPAKSEPKPEPPKPDVVIETPKPPPEEPPHAATPPPTALQTTPAAAEGEVERSIRATLARAAADLSHVDYRGLNADARNQYDTAKNFIRQSETLMAAKNLALAKMLADKSATLAVQLAGKE
jgi:hypothetical protein